MSDLSVTHLFAHLLVFIGYLLAIAVVVPAFATLIRVSLATRVSGAGFFLFCGVTHAGIALGGLDSPVVAATDHLQAVSILVFIVALTRDLTAANRRLDGAFQRIGSDASVTVASALQGVEE